jgi:UDP-N-acetylglucosamine 2-epimerase (non-hydrolysing)
MKRVLFVFGTRPEAIKLAPLILRLRSEPGRFLPIVAVSAQHREMLDQTLEVFRIAPDYDLNIMRPGQTLFEITAKTLSGLQAVMEDSRPDWVVVQGDTTTTFAGALAAFYGKIPVVHVEAGLRTGNIYNPFPEEINRQLVGRIATLHFAPTAGAMRNLLAEGVPAERVTVTGNTSIDALQWVLRNTEDRLGAVLPRALLEDPRRKILLVTTHRRESFGEPMAMVMRALRQIAESHPELSVLFPVHRNPNVRRLAAEHLAETENIVLLDPLDYVPFVQAMQRSFLILTDSGGVQEEGPAIGKPVLVLRDTTERPEGIAAGTAILVGTDRTRIVAAVEELLRDADLYDRMSTSRNPYGDGTSSERIAAVLGGERP